MDLGAAAQHPAREEGIVGVGLERDDPFGDIRKGVGVDPLVGTYVDGGAAARHQLGQDSELRLARARLFRDTPSVEIRRRHQHREPFAERQRHRHSLRFNCFIWESVPSTNQWRQVQGGRGRALVRRVHSFRTARVRSVKVLLHKGPMLR